MTLANLLSLSSFSKLKFIKNQFCSTMGQQHLNWLTLMHMENDHLNTIGFKAIIIQFPAKKLFRNLCWLITDNSYCSISICIVYQWIIIYTLKCLYFSRFMIYYSKIWINYHFIAVFLNLFFLVAPFGCKKKFRPT